MPELVRKLVETRSGRIAAGLSAAVIGMGAYLTVDNLTKPGACIKTQRSSKSYINPNPNSDQNHTELGVMAQTSVGEAEVFRGLYTDPGGNWHHSPWVNPDTGFELLFGVGPNKVRFAVQEKFAFSAGSAACKNQSPLQTTFTEGNYSQLYKAGATDPFRFPVTR